MSDAVWIALIDLAKVFVENFAGIMTAAGVAITGYLTWRNGQKAEAARNAAVEARTVLSAKIDQNTEITQAIKLTKEDMDAQGAGRERLGFIEGRRSATGSMPLGK